MGAPEVLLVDDEPGILHSLSRLLRREPYALTTADSPQDALRRLEAGSYAVLVADHHMPAMGGVELLERTRAMSPDTVRVMLTGDADPQSVIEAVNRGGVHAFITKPWEDEDLRLCIRQAVAEHEAALQSRRLQALTRWQNAALQAANRALSQARRQELETAAGIQRALLTGHPASDVPGLHTAALWVPSRRVDGDFYDFVRHDEHCLDVVVGGAVGRGVPAALLGAATRVQLLRVMSRLGNGLGNRPSLADVAAGLHAEMAPRLRGLDICVSVCLARFDTGNATAHVVNCGHPRPVHRCSATGACTLVGGGNKPLGLAEREAYREAALPLAPGDLFVFCSDGVTALRSRTGEPFGEERLAELVAAQGEGEPQAVVEHIRRSLLSFSGSARFADDVTCVAVGVK
ncbi:MAG: SpoIIE family protein phosphatase [Candidatus Latescibacterota bacterium]